MAENEVKLIIKAIDDTKTAFSSINANLTQLQGAASAIKTAFAGLVASLGISSLTSAFRELFEITDNYKTTIAETAALWTTFTKVPAGKTPGEIYQEWTEYAEEVYEKLTEIDAQILGTRQQAMQMVGVFAQHGQVIDVNNQQQLEGFRNIINAVQIITAGQNQEVQIRQEINALMQGTVNQNSRLMQLLEKINPQIRERIKQWEKEGTVIENVGQMLSGFDAAASDLENIFQAQKTTLQSIVNDILRAGFEPLFREVVENAKKLISYFQTHQDQLASILKDGVEKIKAVWDFIVDTVKLMKPILNDVWGILKDWFLPVLKAIGFVLVDIVGVVLPTMVVLLSNIYKLFKAIVLSALALGAAMTGQFGLAKEYFSGAKEAITSMTDVIGVYEKGVNNILNLTDKFSKSGAEVKTGAVKKGKPSLSVIAPADKEKDKKALDDLLRQYQEFLAELEAERQTGFQREIAQIDKWEIDKLNKLEKYREKGIITQKEYEQRKAEIAEIASEKILTIYEKYAQIEVEIENEITKELLTEHEQRIREIEDWEDEKVKKLQELYNEDAITYEEFQRLKSDAHEAALKKRFEYEQEYQRKIKELQIGVQLSEVKTQEKTGAISKEESIKRQIQLQQELLQLYEQQAVAIAESGNIEAWLQMQQTIEGVRDKIVDLQLQLRELTGTFKEGFAEGVREYLNKTQSAFLRAKETAQQVISGMENAFTGFFDVTSDKFMKFGKLAESILNSIYQALLRALIIQPLVGAITGALGISTKHEGGLVMHAGGYIPRFHFGGLAWDEVPAILQKGEYVVSRKGVQALDKINSGNVHSGDVNVAVNVQNNTGFPIDAKVSPIKWNGKQLVKEIILELKRTDPAFNAELARSF